MVLILGVIVSESEHGQVWPGEFDEPTYGMPLAYDRHDWYEEHAKQSRVLYTVHETLLLIVAAAIPASAAIAHNNVIAPAILGAVVVVLTGVRSVFHWQQNYIRFNGARLGIDVECRNYRAGVTPYDDPATRDQLLTEAVSRIELEGPPAGPGSPPSARGPDLGLLPNRYEPSWWLLLRFRGADGEPTLSAAT